MANWRNGGRRGWLTKAPRRRDLRGRGTRIGIAGRCEKLESRQMLSADGLGFHFGVDPVVAHPDGTLAQPVVPFEDTFTLHSKPDADHTIYLDFDGHITDDPNWYAAFHEFDDEGNLTDPGRYNIEIMVGEELVFVPGIPFSTTPYDLDDDLFDFSDAELLNIQEAFLRVAEDFAPFNVNVTTEEPPQGDLENAGDGDTRWGVRIVSGGSTFDWLTREGDETEAGAGGVALLGSFSSDLDTPAYAFQEGYGQSAKNLAEVISHEAGHTLGLNHDGQFENPIIVDPGNEPTLPEVITYYPGHENGLWGPIMGAAYQPQISQWSIGEYDLANNQEDDLAIIADEAVNGFTFRDDDHANDRESGTLLEGDFDLGTFAGTGLIETNTDVDWFTFEAKQGDVTVSALPVAVGPNLDIKLQLYDELGIMRAESAPDFDQTASLSYSTEIPQRFYVSVTGDGFKANAQQVDEALNGYSDYGSLGFYSLDIQAELGEAPDVFEANNTEIDATVLAPGDYFFQGLSIHENGDEDWFLWESSATGELTVDVLFDHSAGDLDMQIYTEAGTRIGFGGSSSNNETDTVSVAAGERYYIRVYGFGGATQEDYSLSIDGDGLLADALEINDDLRDASNLGSEDQDLSLSLHYDGDVDWFEWLAPADGTLSVETQFDGQEIDLKIEIFDAQRNLVAESQTTALGAIATTQIALDPEVADSGLFRVKISSEANDPEKRVGDYRLLLNGTEVMPDANEPSNTPDDAVVITDNPARLVGLSINTSTDRDFYSFTPTDTGTLRVDLFFLHAFGDLDLRLTDSSGQIVALATSRDDNESLVQRILGGEQYFIEVFGFEGQTNPTYALETTFTQSAAVLGDFSGDAVVSLADRLAWTQQYGSNDGGQAADANGDGIVNAADYTIWRDNLGSGFQISNGQQAEDPSPVEPISDETTSIAFTPISALASAAEGDTTNPFGPDIDLTMDPFAPLEDTFKLHSNPAANHTIYLDFNGHRTENTPWNADQFEGNPDFEGSLIDTLPYDFNGNPFDNHAEEERLVIQETFLRVSEAFSPFNVNVTTEEPDLDDLMRTPGELDERWGIRVVIGGSSLDWLEPLAEEPTIGGIAYLNSFNDPIDNPTFVFGEGNPDPVTLTGTIAHEVGHTLGLGHDGILPEPGWDPDQDPEDPELPMGPVEYYPGHENGLWTAVMGGGAGAVQQWSRGEYFRASNQQDDLAVIVAGNGFGYRQDLAGDTVADAVSLNSLPVTPESITENRVYYEQLGIIERNTDVDVYEFFSSPGEITIDALPAAYGAMLDIKLELFDANGNLLATAAPGATTSNPDFQQLDASLSYNALLPGMYYVAITGDGMSEEGFVDSVEFSGYSDYGSLGEYSLDIEASLGPAPDAFEGTTGNDFVSTAYPLPYADYTLRPSTHLAGDDDYFRWTAGNDGQLTIDLLLNGATELFPSGEPGDLDLRLLNRFGGLLTSIGANGNQNEQITWPVQAGNEYVIHVVPRGDTRFEYTLQIDGPGVPVDGFASPDGDLASQFADFGFEDEDYRDAIGPIEPNNSYDTALPLRSEDLSTPTEGDFKSLADYDLDLSIHEPGDEDYFLWTSPGTGQLTLDVGFAHADANIDVSVELVTRLSQRGVIEEVDALPGGVSESLTDNEQVIVDVEAGMSYAIRVYTAAGSVPGDSLYTFNLDGPQIDADDFEPNDEMGVAQDVSGMSGFLPNLSIDAPDDIDVYRWTADATGDLRARIFFAHADGDLDLRIRSGATGQVIGASTTVTDNESVTQRIVAGNDYFIEVTGFEGATQPNYILDLAFAPAIVIAGDLDGNGFVDILDWGRWRDDYGQTGAGTIGDANGDGVVNAIDYTIWRDNKGEGLEPEDDGHDHGHGHEDHGPVGTPIRSRTTPTQLSNVAERVRYSPETREGLGSVVLTPSPVLATAFEPLSQTGVSLVSGSSAHEEALLLVGEGPAEEADFFADYFAEEAEEEPHDDALADLDDAFAASV